MSKRVNGKRGNRVKRRAWDQPCKVRGASPRSGIRMGTRAIFSPTPPMPHDTAVKRKPEPPPQKKGFNLFKWLRGS